ncbi:hypothetical protein [Spiroplasma endosymbiont of Danaus chrysippus]|uniref:hypothetical protein n=1 Tax=Spiroplasma endosymbiont of Danaus chrysippus TaxID=2691041 RepID=UPI00157BB55A|nr:hypothetical protein [Spiroplasma endosymbiont of Danaus chrysippus]
MKFILKLLSVVTLTSFSVINLNACGVEQGLPQTFTATFDKINKFNVIIINKSIQVMDLKLYKNDVLDIAGSLNDFYNKEGYIKIEISGTMFSKFLNLYGLNMNNSEREIKDKLNNIVVSNGNITIVKYAPYVNFYYLHDFSGKV